jgi:hypothetical protein
MAHRTALLTSLLAATLLAGCRHSPDEGPETAPVGPSIFSEATIKEALNGPVDFKKHIQPLIAQNCLPCHDGRDMPQFVNLTSRASALAPGPYGPRIVPGKPGDSLIVKNLSLTHAPVKSMPPVGNRLTPEETQILRKWIKKGAPWPKE